MCIHPQAKAQPRARAGLGLPGTLAGNHERRGFGGRRGLITERGNREAEVMTDENSGGGDAQVAQLVVCNSKVGAMAMAMAMSTRTTLHPHLRSSFVSSSCRAQLLPSRGCYSYYYPPPSSSLAITNSTLPLPRRCVLLLVSAAPLLLAASSHASPTLPQPSFLRSFGLGDADLYYPSFFEGTWQCFSTLTAVETPQGENKADRRSVEFSRKQLGFMVEYKARFVSFQGNVIGDRSFTTSSLVESTMGKDVIRGTFWDPTNPNRLSLVLRGGVKVENVVTKRSAEATGPGQFDTSEFSKQVFDNSAMKDGPPSVKASQNLTRYRWDPTEQSVNEIEAFQRVAMFPLPGDGMNFADVMGMDKPVTLYKYRVKFTRELGP